MDVKELWVDVIGPYIDAPCRIGYCSSPGSFKLTPILRQHVTVS